jgi:hypothetical protein
MAVKFSQANLLGNHRGGKEKTSALGFRAVESMTAKGKRITRAKGARRSQ